MKRTRAIAGVRCHVRLARPTVCILLFLAICACSQQAETSFDTVLVYEQYVDINGQKYVGSVDDALKARYGTACPQAILATASGVTGTRQAEATDAFAKRCSSTGVVVR